MGEIGNCPLPGVTHGFHRVFFDRHSVRGVEELRGTSLILWIFSDSVKGGRWENISFLFLRICKFPDEKAGGGRWEGGDGGVRVLPPGLW